MRTVGRRRAAVKAAGAMPEDRVTGSRVGPKTTTGRTRATRRIGKVHPRPTTGRTAAGRRRTLISGAPDPKLRIGRRTEMTGQAIGRRAAILMAVEVESRTVGLDPEAKHGTKPPRMTSPTTASRMTSLTTSMTSRTTSPTTSMSSLMARRTTSRMTSPTTNPTTRVATAEGSTTSTMISTAKAMTRVENPPMVEGAMTIDTAGVADMGARTMTIMAAEATVAETQSHATEIAEGMMIRQQMMTEAAALLPGAALS
mmetsp:Transcript_31752/g.75712  ORF Transcript_31752/g.75712 Transcript_31752/m.75712 type:complete len:256 (+) Transcript_31752:226-993(+)